MGEGKTIEGTENTEEMGERINHKRHKEARWGAPIRNWGEGKGNVGMVELWSGGMGREKPQITQMNAREMERN